MRADLPFCKEVEIQKPGFREMSGIRKVYSRFPAPSAHNSLNDEKNLDEFSTALSFTVGQESITYEPPTGFNGSTLCSNTSTTYHLPII